MGIEQTTWPRLLLVAIFFLLVLPSSSKPFGSSSTHSLYPGKQFSIIWMGIMDKGALFYRLKHNSVSKRNSTNLQTNTSTHKSGPIVANFRPARCFSNVYRCAAPDALGHRFLSGQDNEKQKWAESDWFIFKQVGLIIDLRSPSERKEVPSQAWMRAAPIDRLIETELQATTSRQKETLNNRCVVQIDVLSPSRFMSYVDTKWLSPGAKITDGKKLHDLRIEQLNRRGLAGLNEAILETGKKDILWALKILTIHLEKNPKHSIVIHCVQGKDRTGMLIMLLQSILGASDQEIIEDYFLSDRMLRDFRRTKSPSQSTLDGSAAAARSTTERGSNESKPHRRGQLDRRFFSGTNREAMIRTLAFLRNQYGSILPGYLDSIGFDAIWRERLLNVLVPHPDFLSTNKRSKL